MPNSLAKKCTLVTAAAVSLAVALGGCATNDSVDGKPVRPAGGASSSTPSSGPSNVVFLNNPTVQDVLTIDNYVVTQNGQGGQPFFNNVVLFAAGIDSNRSATVTNADAHADANPNGGAELPVPGVAAKSACPESHRAGGDSGLASEGHHGPTRVSAEP